MPPVSETDDSPSATWSMTEVEPAIVDFKEAKIENTSGPVDLTSPIGTTKETGGSGEVKETVTPAKTIALLAPDAEDFVTKIKEKVGSLTNLPYPLDWITTELRREISSFPTYAAALLKELEAQQWSEEALRIMVSSIRPQDSYLASEREVPKVFRQGDKLFVDGLNVNISQMDKNELWFQYASLVPEIAFGQACADYLAAVKLQTARPLAGIMG